MIDSVTVFKKENTFDYQAVSLTLAAGDSDPSTTPIRMICLN